MTVLKTTADLGEFCAQKIGIYISRYPPPRDLERQLRDFLSQVEINVELNVGASTGNYAIKLRLAEYRGRIISFEPFPVSYDELHARMHRGSFWCGQPFGLSDDNREAQLRENRIQSPKLDRCLAPERGIERIGLLRVAAERQ